MSSLPFRTTTVTAIDVEPDELELADVRCEHRDGDRIIASGIGGVAAGPSRIA